MKTTWMGLLCIIALLGLGVVAAAEELCVVRSSATLAPDQVITNPQVSGDRATYQGTLRVYVTQPTSTRWRDDDGAWYQHALLDFTTNVSINIPDGSTYYASAVWNGNNHGWGSILETNIEAVAAVFNIDDTVLDAYPGNGYWFTAHFGDASAAATPGLPGYNTTPSGYTHTVFLEEGTACW
jgi:hypothetical protein